MAGHTESRSVVRDIRRGFEQQRIGALPEAHQQDLRARLGPLERAHEQQQRMRRTGVAAGTGQVIHDCAVGQPDHLAEPRRHAARAREDGMIDAPGRDAGVVEERVDRGRNDFEEPLVAHPAVFERVVETIALRAVVIHQVTAERTVSQRSREQVTIAACHHCRGAVTDLHLQGVRGARFAAVACNHQ